MWRARHTNKEPYNESAEVFADSGRAGCDEWTDGSVPGWFLLGAIEEA